MNKIRIMIVDDHPVLRQGIMSILKGEQNIDVIAEASDGNEAIETAKKFHPDVILMDITMPNRNGLHAASMIKKEMPNVRIIIFSVSDNREFILQALQIGVSGYLLKETAASEVVTAIRETHKGNAFFSPAISKVLVDIHQGNKDELSQLTLREREVLQLLAEGNSNKQIGTSLDISTKTIEKYRLQIMKKLDIHDAVGLTRYAISKCIVKI